MSDLDVRSDDAIPRAKLAVTTYAWRSWRATVGALSSRQVNLLLAISTLGAVATGLTSWAIGTGWSRWWTALHATCGVMVLVLAPAKMTRSVRPGMRRGRPTRWVSAGFGVMMIAIVALGFAHSTGLWAGVGYWSSLWTHFLLAFAAIPLLVWHVASRPARPRVLDVNRRLFLGGGTAFGLAALTVAAVEGSVRLFGLDGGDRRFTGSHQVGSFDPDEMPRVSWIDDTAPSTPIDEWALQVDGEPIEVAELSTRCRPVVAALDCTGGWWSEQEWDVVPVAELIRTDAPSFKVESATGYSRVFPMRDAEVVYLSVGYGGRPLRRGHGAPVRVVAPGRRGPWWIKWVVSVEPTDQPSWLQFPFPLT